ncbi:MAG: peptide chain release factor N(5)-glutamine methyltransferase [Candidatus Puniceispirillaceae bacterium]
MAESARQLLHGVRAALNTDNRLDARWLVGLACGLDSPVMSHQNISLTPEQESRLATLIAQRNAGLPISRMRGKREFWSLDFYLNDATLDPRPDSETLISAALEYATAALTQISQPKILDLGCGSGCLLLSLLTELEQASGVGIDRAPLAVAQARANTAALGLAGRAHIHTGNWAAGLDGTFHLILSNPPYICEGDDSLSDEVRLHDPSAALFAGADGLSAYRILLPQLGAILAPEGQAFLEVGWGQIKAVSKLAEDAGLTVIQVHKDLAGIERCLAVAK